MLGLVVCQARGLAAQWPGKGKLSAENRGPWQHMVQLSGSIIQIKKQAEGASSVSLPSQEVSPTSICVLTFG